MDYTVYKEAGNKLKHYADKGEKAWWIKHGVSEKSCATRFCFASTGHIDLHLALCAFSKLEMSKNNTVKRPQAWIRSMNHSYAAC